MDNEAINTIAGRLGVTSYATIKKAEELYRLLNLHHCEFHISSSCKTIVCIDLASTATGEKIEKQSAVRLSGVSARAYTSALHAIEALLDLQPKVTISDLCVQFGCQNAKNLAVQIRQSYEKTDQSNVISDALLNTTAVHVACKRLKSKVDKRKLVEIAGCKPSMFDRLVTQLEALASTLPTENKQPGTTNIAPSRQQQLVDSIESQSHVTGGGDAERDGQQRVTEEPYEIWRRRILVDAYHKLGKKYTPRN